MKSVVLPIYDGFMIDMLEVNADSCQDCSVVLQGALVIRRVWGLGSYGIYADNPINQGNLGFGQMDGEHNDYEKRDPFFCGRTGEVLP